MARAIGLGGVFIKFKDPHNMRKWYAEVLGLTVNDHGVLFSFNDQNDGKRGYLQLGTFEQSTTYFGSPEQQVMLNFRVDDLNGMIEKLKEHNTKILNEVEEYSYGKFLHIEDPEGNRLELWEPAEDDFSEEPSTEMN